MPEPEYDIDQMVDDAPPQDGGGDPLGLEKKLQNKRRQGDPLGLESQLQQKRQQPQQRPVSTPTPPPFDLMEATKRAMPYLSGVQMLSDQNQHTKQIQQSANDFVKTFNDNKDQAINTIVSHNTRQELIDLGARYEDGQIDEKAFKANQSALFNKLLNNQQEVNKYKQEMGQDQTKLRRAVHQIAESNPSLAPKLQSDMYILDSKDRSYNASKILYNANQMKEGGLTYNILHGQVQRPEGFFESVGTGFGDRNRLLKDYDFYNNSTDAEVINRMELMRAKYDPDEPIKTPSGMGGYMGKMIGFQGIVTAEGVAAGGLTALLPVVGEAAAPWAAAAATSGEFYKTGYVGSFENEYHRLRNIGMSPEEALTKARNKAKFDASVDVAQGVAATAIGTKIGVKPSGAVSAEVPPGFINTLKDIAIKSGKWVGATAPEQGINAAIGMGAQEIKNIYAGKPPEEGILETGMGQLLFGYAIGGLTKAGQKILSPTAQRSLLAGLSKAPEEQVNRTIGQMVNDGTISPEEANNIHNQIQDYKTAGNKIPATVVDEGVRSKIQELINKRTTLEGDLNIVDKAYHPNIKEQIATINEQIVGLSQKGTKISPEEKQPTFKSPIDRAKELINAGTVKGFTEAPLKEAAASEDPAKLEAMLRDVAQQAHDPATASSAEQTYGPGLVKIAKELHPEHYISEPAAIPKTAAEETIVPEEKGVDKFPTVKIDGTEVGEHGEDTHTARQLHNGIEPTDLTEKGIGQAKDLGAYVAEKEKNEIISSEVERAKQTAQYAAQESERLGHPVKTSTNGDLNTWNIGEFDGKPEGQFKEKYFIEHPEEKVPGGGESFNEFKSRMEKAYAFTEAISKETQVISHSKTLRAMRSLQQTGGKWTELTTEIFQKWHDVEKMQRDSKAMEESYNRLADQAKSEGKNPEEDADLKKMKQSIVNLKNKADDLRKETEAIHSPGRKAVPEIEKEEGAAKAPSIPTTSKTEEHATAIRGDQGRGREGGNAPESSQNEGGQNIQLDEKKETKPAEAQQQAGPAEPAAGGVGDLPFGHLPVGISHEAQVVRRLAELGVEGPERGEGVEVPQSLERGKELLDHGVDPEKIADDFKKDPEKKISYDGISIVRAKYNELAKAFDRAADQYGENSPQAREAANTEAKWLAEVVKPMQTEWHKIGQAQQGFVDLDTSTVASIKRAFKEVSGKSLTESQSKAAKDFHDKIKEKDKQISDLQKQLDQLHESQPTPSATKFTDKAKKIADSFRKLKTKEFTFKDENGNDIPIQKMGASWNELVEIGAKAIEKTGVIADGIAAIVSKAKDLDWYKSLSENDKNRFEKELADHYVGIADKKTATRIKYLEKQLSDLQAGEVKSKGAKRTKTAREKELEDQIFEAKRNLGLIKPKATLQPKTKISSSDISATLVDKKDNTFTPEQSKYIWGKAKELLEKGKTDFHDVVHQISMDTGLSAEQVRRAIAQPKGAKTITNDMYNKMYQRNLIVQQARAWVKSADQPWPKKYFNSVIKFPASIAVALHGSVAPITHVGADLFRPTNWKSYFNFMLNAYKYSFGGVTKKGIAAYEKAMSDLVRDPLYPLAKEAGAKVDPTDRSGDDYSNYAGLVGRIGRMGDRGFNAMKPYRLEQFKNYYNNLSDQAKSDQESLKAIGQMVNLGSGTSDVKIPEWVHLGVFAPKLVLSQYQRIFSEPAKAVTTFVTWGRSTTAQKLQAKMVARHAAEMVTTYMAALAANQAWLSMTGSNQSINFTNPLEPDWMRFKAAGKTVDASGGMNSALRFVTSLAYEGLRANGIVHTPEKSKPGDVEGRKILQQMTNKLSPAGGDLVEVFSGTDINGNPVPWSSVKPAKGKEQLTWTEYLESKMPIFMAEGFKAFNDAASENGMPKDQLNNIWQGIIIGVLTGTTGAKIAPEKEKQTGGGTDGGGGGGYYGR